MNKHLGKQLGQGHNILEGLGPCADGAQLELQEQTQQDVVGEIKTALGPDATVEFDLLASSDNRVLGGFAVCRGENAVSPHGDPLFRVLSYTPSGMQVWAEGELLLTFKPN